MIIKLFFKKLDDLVIIVIYVEIFFYELRSRFVFSFYLCVFRGEKIGY